MKRRMVARLVLCAALLVFEIGGRQAGAACVAKGAGVRITELMYHPMGGDAYEYVELQNAGDQVADMVGWRFDGIALVFGEGASLNPGQVIIVVSAADPDAFSRRYPGVDIADVFAGKLANDGERISLLDAQGQVVDRVEYGDGGFWEEEADGTGRSLERVRLDGASSDPSVWRASTAPLGTPGTVTRDRTVGVRLTEVHQALVGEGEDEWIELHNDSPTTVSIEGWSLSDRASEPRRFVFPAGVQVASEGYLVVPCGVGTNRAGWTTGFGLDAGGETLILYDRQTNRVDAITVGQRVAGFAWGWVGAAWTLTSPTPGQSNVAAVLAPLGQLVVNEWMANALPGDQDWLELYNRDLERPVLLTGTWLAVSHACARLDGLAAVPPRGFLRLWADERPGPDHLDLKLPAGGGSIQLGESSGTTTEHLDYGPQGDGVSQGRVPDGGVGIEFFPLSASPGASNATDQDADGQPDFWERKHGLDPIKPEDAAGDLDGDGQSNLAEYQAGNNPLDGDDFLSCRIERMPSGYVVKFSAVSGRGYALLRSTSARRNTWRAEAIWPARSTKWQGQWTIPIELSGAYYQVVTPPPYGVVSQVTRREPAPGSLEVASSQLVRIEWSRPFDPSQLRSDTLEVRDDSGRRIAGRVRVNADFTAIEFAPSLPWMHHTVYSVSLKPIGPEPGTGDVSGALNWVFTTAKAPTLVEDRSIYAHYPTNTLGLSLEVLADGGGWSWADVLADKDPYDSIEPSVSGRLTERSPGGAVGPWPVMARQRGYLSREAPLASFRIKLEDASPSWRDQQVIHLLKGFFDGSRIRNRLSYALAAEIPNLISLRTAFVDLQVDGKDYGLYTQVENPDLVYLRSRGLDPEGHLYKVESFQFRRDSDELRLTTDPGYVRQLFEQHLEIRGSSDHAKLLRMVEDLEDVGLSTARVLDRHFHRGNLLAWWAFNILLGNQDSNNRNFLLYSPSEASAWYFLPWDYDYAFSDVRAYVEEGGGPRIVAGLGNWWDSLLFERIIRDEGVRGELMAEIERMRREEVTATHIRILAQPLYPVVAEYIGRAPDLIPPALAEDARGVLADEFEAMPTVPENNHRHFMETLDWPMPVRLGDPSEVPGGWRFSWTASYDLQGDAVTYDFDLARSPRFLNEEIVASVRKVAETQTTVVAALEPGTYYWRVLVRDVADPEHHWQMASNVYYDAASGQTYHGVGAFVVVKPL